MIITLNLRKGELSDLEWIQQRYKEMEFSFPDFQNEVFAIAEWEGKRAGLGRLMKLGPNMTELGGMYVLPEFRKKGIAREIVQFLLNLSQKKEEIYCIPFVHLVDFYKSFGFEPVQKMTALPDAVLSRYSWCKKNDLPDTTLMKLV